MAVIVKPFTFAAGALVIASEHNSNYDTIITDYNGNITNANISASAAITITKLSGVAASGANSDITAITGLSTPLGPAYGGHGVANNAASTLTISGNFGTTLTVSGTTSVTLPTSGTLLASGGALGTPSSGTLTSCTGLPVAGITASTSTALGVGSIELGHATDTTLSRSASGVLQVEGVVIPSISSTNTLTNKRVTKRAISTTQSATPTINTDNTDVSHITGLAQAITSMTTNLSGTPVEGDTLRIDITDNGSARAITWGSSFEASGTVALPTTTVLSVRLDVGFFWNTVTSKWRCVAVA